MAVAYNRGLKINNSADMLSSLSSGLTNILRDGIKFTVVIISYAWLVESIALFHLQPTWLAIFIAFIVQDFSGYWIHRLNHRVNIFWNRHVIHHSSEEFNLACALRQSISNTFRFSAIFMIPAALLGIPAYYFAIMGPIHLFLQFWYHTQLIDKMGFLEHVLVTPSHHRVHHAINPIYLDRNYSQIFIFWDKLFGTFQKELSEEKPVYGILRPAKTWNPIIISYKHLWQLMKDAWHAEKLKDKLIIWFMPTGWRPDGVGEKYPIKIISDPKKQSKYETNNSLHVLIWSWLQLFIALFLMFHLFFMMSSMDAYMVFIYAGFLIFHVFSYTSLLDGKNHAYIGEVGKMLIAFFILYSFDFNWHGIEGVLLNLFILYLFISVGLTNYFLKSD
jgi:sterol desaturase/sphingolipid hydroxylase (fatty acid hydroxylase superfamily)